MKVIHLGLVISMLGLAGCGGPKTVETKNASDASHPVSSDNQPAGKVDACGLLTKADAESLLGEPVAEPTTSRTEAMGNIVTQYRYKSASGRTVGLLTFVLRIMPKETRGVELTTIYTAPYQMEIRHIVFDAPVTSDPVPIDTNRKRRP